ncbi:EAL domain-containing protein [Halomonas chromatireducens]|uniref:Phytochrome-like protein cph2 n=1 Tax=Halomonas chromatireducens TaxID=507626 RepID=A0A0X8HCI6_9GAMM|nr:EAL domain-containing protein [Halomonas chromatireducens]AMD00132.1 Phytochrome-like protein cph2 [Halomonas chromatireducens]
MKTEAKPLARAPRIHVAADFTVGGDVVLPEGPARHVARVLRMGEGAPVRLFDGHGREASAVLIESGRKRVVARIEAVEAGTDKMQRLKALGISFAMDDFGTGYSSLQYLKRLPLDQIKIDQGFVRDLLASHDDMAIARTIIAMGIALQLEVVAEGVETSQQLEWLTQEGCHVFQGYFFCQPVPVEQLERLLEATEVN